jgi:hypothetical protein
VLYSSLDQDARNGGADGSAVDNNVLLPSGTINAPITVTNTVYNNGLADLNIAMISFNGTNKYVDCSGAWVDLPPAVLVPAGGSAQFVFCTLVSCPGLTLTAVVRGTAVSTTAIPCIYDSCGHVVTTAASSCPATVTCVPPVSARVTGGGDLLPGMVDQSCIPVATTILPSGPVKITHGGQLGAPYNQQDCGTTIGNPCIRGQWSHHRHYDGNNVDAFDVDFHSSNPGVIGYYDSLEVACLGCCINGAFVPASTAK